MRWLVIVLVLVGSMAGAGLAKEGVYRLPRARREWYPSDELGFAEHGLKYEMQIDTDVVVAYEAVDEDLVLALAVRFNGTIGWFGIGPSENGGMEGSNPCVVRESPLGSGRMAAFAYHAYGFVEPTLNADQNCELLQYNAIDGEAYFMIRRPLVGCKPEDLDIHSMWEQRWIFAWSDRQEFSYHGPATRGTAYFNAIYGPMPDYELPDDAFALDALTTPNVLPAQRDIYTCRAFKLPSDQRYHVIRWDPILQDISPATYHHMILYNCANGIPPDWQDGELRSCRVGGTLGCMRFFIGWAIGQPITWTEPAGIAVGAGPSPVTHSVYLESHIDSPLEAPGIIDEGWGLRLWMTPTLRDIESMILGFYIGISEIPPRMAEFTHMSECPQECLQAGMDEDGIVFQGIAPHMHEIGLKSKVFIVRDGVEVPALHEMNHFDPNWQGIHAVHPDAIERTRLRPGDRLIGLCTWDSSERDYPTYFGEGFQQEMCTPFINLYPAFSNSMTIIQQWPGHIVDGDQNIITPGSATGSCDGPPWVGTIDANNTWTKLPPPANNCNIRT